MELTEAIEQIEKRYFRTAADTGANSNALLIHNALRTLAGLPRLSREDLRDREVNEYKAKMADAFLAGDEAKALRYREYARSALAAPIERY